MRRREFIAGLGGSAAAWPLAVRAQQAAIPAVGYLSVGEPVADYIAALRKGLGEQGYFEGLNFVFEPRSTEDYNRLPALAAELVAHRVAAIFTFMNSNAAQAAQTVTSTIPIVFTLGADPVVQGLVASLNRPGANVTGVGLLAQEIEPKRIELLRELVPQASTIAFLANPASASMALSIRNLQAAAQAVRQSIIIMNASTPAEIDSAFARLASERAGGLLVGGDAFFEARRSQIIVLAARYGTPAVYFASEFTRAGGLMSYSDDRAESFRQAGLYVGRILKGEKPADLPVLQPTKFTFAINLSTARAVGLEFPPSFLLRADEVIQ
jgi:putative tryptophan/tyrosine transport system substrate-binding protein